MSDPVTEAREAHERAKNATSEAKQKVREAEDHLKKMQYLEHISFMALCDAGREAKNHGMDMEQLLKEIRRASNAKHKRGYKRQSDN